MRGWANGPCQFVWNANPAVIAPDQRKVLEGFRREELFTVVHEQFLTDTARHADIVLPATTMLEQEDLVGSWGFNGGGALRALDPRRGERELPHQRSPERSRQRPHVLRHPRAGERALRGGREAHACSAK